jgi:UDP-MurNAc hydroxylase
MSYLARKCRPRARGYRANLNIVVIFAAIGAPRQSILPEYQFHAGQRGTVTAMSCCGVEIVPRATQVKFTILSHAGVSIDHGGVRLVCDPWLLGSCYWRSWWNYPEPDPSLLRNLAPQFIYLTHLHWDHFHGPSLRNLFDRNTTILVPKIPSMRMIDDLRWLGFHNITEIPHGQKHALGPDFTIHSYQFGLSVDSGAVITGGGHTIFNCNDCKFFGLPLRQILRRHKNIDFILRSHSSASPIPLCIENYKTVLPNDDGDYDSANQFARCAIHTGARYAIPFASNHCFLHPETQHFNSTATSPDIAKSRYAALAAEVGAATECVVMPPGSSWSDTDGFAIADFDFSQRETHIEQMLLRHADTLRKQVEKEARAIGDFVAFKGYIEQFFRSMPVLFRRWGLAAMVFRVSDCNGLHLWLADPRTASVSQVDVQPPGTLMIDVHATVLNDCVKSRMFSVWTPSKRLTIHLPRATALKQAHLWFNLFDMYETDLLPIRRNLGLRSLGVRLRRWRDPVELVRLALRRIFLGQRLTVTRIYPVARPGGKSPLYQPTQ